MRATSPGGLKSPSAQRADIQGGDIQGRAQRGDIQGMRATAVLLVMLSHAQIRGLSGGYVGVDVFFVISGFLITGILVREVRKTGRISIASFYARRARRILPAATLVLLAIVAVSTLTLTSARLHDVMTHVTWAALFAANIYSSRSGSDYFSEGAFIPPVQHFWSLAVEEQFYLLWPPLIALILFATHRRRRPGSEDTAASRERQTALQLRRLTVAICVLCGLSLGWSVWQTGAAPTKAYYSTLTRGWELGVGALLALCAGWVARQAPVAKFIASWAGLAAIATAATTYSATTPFPGYRAMLPVLGAALVLGGGIEGPRYGARLVLDTPPMRWIGDISYSLYLWHWPFLVIPELYLARKLTLVERLALMSATIVVAWLSYRFVETPVRRSTLLSRGPRGRVRSLLLWPSAISLVVVAVLIGGTQAAVSHNQGPASAVLGARSGNVANGSDPAVDAIHIASGLARSSSPLPASLHPSLEDLFADVSRLPTGCFAERDETAVSSCVRGDPKGTRTIVFFGDSHLIMWLSPVERLAKASGWRIIPFEKASCFPLDATLWRADKLRSYTECDTWRADVYQQIAKIKPERIVVSGLLPPTVTDPATGKPAEGAATRRLFDDGVAGTLRKLRKASQQVYVIGGTPNLEKTAGDCLGTRKATMATCARPASATLKQRNLDWQKASVSAGAKFIDPLPWFCSDNLCPVVVGNIIIYRDNNHITRTFAETLESQLARRLNL